jgi:aminopeptidase N
MKPQHFLAFLFLLSATIGFSQIPQIDVIHYKIEIYLSDESDQINVEEEIKFIHLDSKKPIVFNLASQVGSGKGMYIDELKLNGKTPVFRHENDSIYIDSDAKKPKPQTLKLSFTGVPKDGLVIGKNKYKSRTFFGDNWPTRAQNWFACNDHLSDKATVEYLVHAPKHYEVVANGKLLSVKKKKNIRTHHYSSSVVLPTKVMVIGVADLLFEELGMIEGTPVRSYAYPKNHKDAFYDLSLAPSILQFYINYISPYEYAKLDNVQSTTRFGGMENAGCIFYDEDALSGKQSSENLIAHEIVHQWFGNSATEKDWCHLWLSEGFATYLTNVYIEQTKGKEAFHEQLKQDRNRIVSFDKRYKAPVVDTTYNSLMDLLNPNSYQKGGWILHMLRNEIGDKHFHQTIQNYYKKYRLSNADTRDFQHIAEQTSGADLHWFFDQWLYKRGHPKLNIETEIHETVLAISVSQLDDLFKVTLPIKVHFKNGTNKVELLYINNHQTRFKMKYNAFIESIEIDPDVQLLFEEVR